jgi:hypothetical protein
LIDVSSSIFERTAIGKPAAQRENFNQICSSIALYCVSANLADKFNISLSSWNWTKKQQTRKYTSSQPSSQLRLPADAALKIQDNAALVLHNTMTQSA